MAQEIERKFLFSPDGIDLSSYPHVNYRQGYLMRDGATLRIRIAGDKAFLTLKGVTRGISRSEFEYPVPVEDAEQILKEFCGSSIIEKERYFVEWKGSKWECDVFAGTNKGLFLAEIELSSEEEYFEIPDWIIKEVSGDSRFYNSRLVRFPFSTWAT